MQQKHHFQYQVFLDPTCLKNKNKNKSEICKDSIVTIRYIIWHNHKFTILKIIAIFFLSIFLLAFFYALPGYTVKKMLGA